MDTYGDLKTQVLDWLNRADADLPAKIPTWVRLVETDIYRDLRCDDNEFVATYTPTEWGIEGQATSGAWATGDFLLLPPNYREMTQVSWNGTPLTQVSRSELTRQIASVANAETLFFAISGRRIIFSLAIPPDPLDWDVDDALEYVYYGVESLDAVPTWQVSLNPVENPAVPDLTPQALTQVDENTTRMFQRNPDVYLTGTLYYGSLHLQHDAGALKWGALFRGSLEALKMESENRAYSGSTTTVACVYSD